jgi:hypothetical protein
MFAVPQTTTPQSVVVSTFLEQLQMATPTLTQLSSPLTTGPLVFESPARTTLPSPRMSSLLPSFTTPQTQGLGQEDHYLRVVTKQISTAIASNPDLQGPEATQVPTSGTETSTAPPPPRPRSSTSPAWSGLYDDSDEDNTSDFSVEPSKAISTSPTDPSSPPHQD